MAMTDVAYFTKTCHCAVFHDLNDATVIDTSFKTRVDVIVNGVTFTWVVAY